MDIALLVAALALAAVALGLVVDTRARTTRIADHLTAARREVERIQEELNAVRGDLDHVRRELEQGLSELGELKAATDITPAPPPLPRTRGGRGGLEDLRQRLRDAHTEEEPAEE